jgi:phenylalanyl-tRNA synthetase alpha subunit
MSEQHQKYAEVYAQKTTDELYRILGEGGLVEPAFDCLCKEFSSRGISMFELFCSNDLYPHKQARSQLDVQIQSRKNELANLMNEMNKLKAELQKKKLEQKKKPRLIKLMLERKRLEEEQKVQNLRQKIKPE